MVYKADRLFNEIIELEKKIGSLTAHDPQSLTDYFRNYTSLIFNYKEVGHIYDIYADDVVVYRENGGRLCGVHNVMRDAVAFLGAFPDLSLTFVDAFVVEEAVGYKLWRYYYLNGTNLSHSQYGAPTHKTLDGEKCLVMNMATVEIKSGRPQIVKEFTMYSSEWIREVCTAAPAAKQCCA